MKYLLNLLGLSSKVNFGVSVPAAKNTMGIPGGAIKENAYFVRMK